MNVEIVAHATDERDSSMYTPTCHTFMQIYLSANQCSFHGANLKILHVLAFELDYKVCQVHGGDKN